MSGDRPDLLSYLNYRAFLRDYFDYERGRNPRLSLRALAARIVPALASSGLLSGVLNGKKNLGHDLRVKFSAGLKLKTREAQCPVPRCSSVERGGNPTLEFQRQLWTGAGMRELTGGVGWEY